MIKKAIGIIVALCMAFAMMPAVGMADDGKPYPVEGRNIYYKSYSDRNIIIGADKSIISLIVCFIHVASSHQ